MREREFIEKNKTKWAKLERVHASKTKDPEELAELYVEVTNDLSYAKSYYPNRSIRVYLNNLAMMIHSSVYRVRDNALKRFTELWTRDIPIGFYHGRKSLLTSAVIFFIAIFIGAFSAEQDVDFTATILSSGYVEMTLENIDKGQPFEVYNDSNAEEMMVAITTNNIMVALRTFVTGLLFMVGTIFVLIHNGVMLGAFHHIFAEHGLLLDSLLTVWMHGMPEISAIIIAGGAGLEVGRSIVFPGTYERKEAFVVGARRGMLMMIPVIALLVYAGFVESYITRHTDINDLFRGSFILINAIAIWAYCTILPKRIWGQHQSHDSTEEVVPEPSAHDYALEEIKSNTRIFADAMALFAREFTRFLLPALGLATIGILIAYFIDERGYMESFYVPVFDGEFIPMAWLFEGTSSRLSRCLDFASFHWLAITFVLTMTGAGLFALRALVTEFAPEGKTVEQIKWPQLTIFSLVLVMGLASIFFLSFGWAIFIAPFIMSMVAVAMVNLILPSDNKGFKSIFDALRMAFGTYMFPIILIGLCGFLFVMVMDSVMVDYVIQTMLSNIKMDADTYNMLIRISGSIITFWVLTLLFPAFIFSAFFSYWSSSEKWTARHLIERLSRIGERKKAYGILKE